VAYKPESKKLEKSHLGQLVFLLVVARNPPAILPLWACFVFTKIYPKDLTSQFFFVAYVLANIGYKH
jgi:hypothetical protein